MVFTHFLPFFKKNETNLLLKMLNRHLIRMKYRIILKKYDIAFWKVIEMCSEGVINHYKQTHCRTARPRRASSLRGRHSASAAEYTARFRTDSSHVDKWHSLNSICRLFSCYVNNNTELFTKPHFLFAVMHQPLWHRK